MRRRGKQAVIIGIYVALFTLIGGGVFFGFFYQKPTCTDGRQNQDERGIDCGGRCSEYCLFELTALPIAVSEVQALGYGSASSDAVGTVQNRNNKAALKGATYTFTAYGSDGSVVATQSGTFSLLPLESRILPALGLSVPKSAISRIELVISNEEWVAMTDFTEPPAIRVVNPQFALLSGQAGYAEARGLVQNRSPFDIRTLQVVVVVRDASNQPLSVNRTTLNTLQSGEQRDFRLVWPQAFAGTPAGTEMQVHFDMLTEDAFIRQYFPSGEFQSLEMQEGGVR